MIYTKITIDGTEYTNYINMNVNRSTSDFSATSNFSITFPSPFGRHKNSFTVGDEVIIYADDTDATTKILTGIIEDINFSGQESTETCTIRGRDYSARLMDKTIEPVVYTDSEISTIVKNIIDNELPEDITYTNVATTETTLNRIAFNHTTIMDAFKQLAELSGFYFYVDDDKDLNFKKNENIASGFTFNESDILSMSFDTTREQMANDVWVYGDRYLAGFQEVLSAGSPLGGSVFTLISKPHDTYVEYLGTPRRGGVYELVSTPTSGTEYLVSYHDRQLIFTSGTDLGNSIPASGGSVLCRYNREIPIVKTGQDRASISLYGIKTKIINDKSIKDPRTASDILKKELEKSDPFRGISFDIKGWYDLTPGTTANVELDNFNLNEEGIPIIAVSYIFDKNRCLSDKVISINLDKKQLDITDEITNLRRRLELIEAQDRQDTDVITRLESSVGSLMVVGSYWEVRTNQVTGSAYHLYSTGFVPPVNPFHLASGTDQGYLAGSFTGSAEAFTQLSAIRSGGYGY